MNEVRNTDPVTVELSGRIDSGNASAVETEILSGLSGKTNLPLVLDAEKLEYISSAGLRVILRLKKNYPDLCVKNVSSDVYEILEMTGFTEMMRVEKAYRVVSVEGCEVIGEGFNGKVYRIDKDNVVKTYKNADALAEIQHEREVAKLALILGVPTAISYDVVRVGDSYGSVFELLNAKSFAKILAKEPERMDYCVREYVRMLKKIHSIEVPEGKLPSRKARLLKSVARIKDSLPDGLGEKLERMTEAIPESNHMIHGDFHTKNIVVADGEVLLIDMDTLSTGHPIFELVSMYNSYVGYSEYDPEIVIRFQGFNAETARKFWHESLAAYLGTKDEDRINEVEEKVRILSYTYLYDWGNRHPAAVGEHGEETMALWKGRLVELLKKVDSLVFEAPTDEKAPAEELDVEADESRLMAVTAFVNRQLEKTGCSPKTVSQIDIAVEEIFVNIASYAYAPGKGRAAITVEISGEPEEATIVFKDSGIPYDPLAKTDPDTTLSANEREIGGLGIFMTKKIMDSMSYEYKDGQNVLTLKKKLS